MKFNQFLLAAALAVASIGAAQATATVPVTIYDLVSSPVKGSPGSFKAIFDNTAGYTTGMLDFTLIGYNTLDGSTLPKWTDTFTLSLNDTVLGTGHLRLGGGGTTDWTWTNPATGTMTCPACAQPQASHGGIATFSDVVLSGLNAGKNTIKFQYSGKKEGLQNESWQIKDAVVTAVPEPETYAMLLAGLCLMGAIARRRQDKQT